MRKSLDSLIVKPVGAKCNLNCNYCFYLDKEKLYPDARTMNTETLHELLKQMSEQSGKQYNITWQGGEPSLAGLSFFKEVVKTQILLGEKTPKIIGNSLQTNGTLLNDEWISFLAKYQFLVGLSIDGPLHLHDNFRKNKNGNGSWEKALKNGRKLLKAGVAVNILACITKYNVTKADLLYDFFKEENFTWLQFNPVFETDADGKTMDLSIDAKELGVFMCRIFDRWFEEFMKRGNAPVIRFIENAFYAHLGMLVPECSFQETCGPYLLVEQNGDVFSCDFFVDESTKLGNLHESRLFDMLNSTQQEIFGEKKKEMHNDCFSCPWLQMCYGGCKKYRDRKTGKNQFCDAYRMFFSYSNARLKKLAEIWKIKKPQKNNDTFDATALFK